MPTANIFEAARLLRVSPFKVCEWANDGLLKYDVPADPDSPTLVLVPEDIEKFLDRIRRRKKTLEGAAQLNQSELLRDEVVCKKLGISIGVLRYLVRKKRLSAVFKNGRIYVPASAVQEARRKTS